MAPCPHWTAYLGKESLMFREARLRTTSKLLYEAMAVKDKAEGYHFDQHHQYLQHQQQQQPQQQHHYHEPAAPCASAASSSEQTAIDPALSANTYKEPDDNDSSGKNEADDDATSSQEQTVGDGDASHEQNDISDGDNTEEDDIMSDVDSSEDDDDASHEQNDIVDDAGTEEDESMSDVDSSEDDSDDSDYADSSDDEADDAPRNPLRFLSIPYVESETVRLCRYLKCIDSARVKAQLELSRDGVYQIDPYWYMTPNGAKLIPFGCVSMRLPVGPPRPPGMHHMCLPGASSEDLVSFFKTYGIDKRPLRTVEICGIYAYIGEFEKFRCYLKNSIATTHWNRKTRYSAYKHSLGERGSHQLRLISEEDRERWNRNAAQRVGQPRKPGDVDKRAATYMFLKQRSSHYDHHERYSAKAGCRTGPDMDPTDYFPSRGLNSTLRESISADEDWPEDWARGASKPLRFKITGKFAKRPQQLSWEDDSAGKNSGPSMDEVK